MGTATKDRKHIDELHFEHRLWSNQLKFYRDELKIFNHRLEELAKANTKTEVTARIEQYQNQVIRQNEVIDELLHRINEHEHGLAKEAIDHPIAIDHVLFADHTKLREDGERNNEIQNQFKSTLMKALDGSNLSANLKSIHDEIHQHPFCCPRGICVCLVLDLVRQLPCRRAI